MNTAASVQSMRWAAIWPWRGLVWALLAAVLAHIAVWQLATAHISLKLQSSAEAASFSTRMINPAPDPLVAAAPISQLSNRQDKASTAAQRSASPELVSNAAVAQPTAEASKNESNQALARIQTAQNATETIAISALASDVTTAQSAAPASAEPAIPSLKLSYPANTKLQFDGTFMSKGSANSGSAVLSWKMDGASYELSLEATALIILTRLEKSEGQLSPQGLAPQRYSSQRNRRSEQAAHFRSELGKIQFSNNKPDAPLLAGAQDRLSALIQLAGMISGDPERYASVSKIQMQVAGLDSADLWEFNLQGMDELSIAATKLRALKLSRTPRNEYDQRLEIWLAPQWGYLPVRIRHSSVITPEQDFTDLVLRQLP